MRSLLVFCAALTMASSTWAGQADWRDGETRVTQIIVKGQLLVIGLDGKDHVYTAADLAPLPRAKANLRSGDKAAGYEGVTLSAVLKEAGVPSGPRLHGKPVASLVVLTGEDGYRVVLSLAEIDPSFRDGAIILADRKADGPLDANEGPWRLVIDADKRPERSIRQVWSIKVVPAP